MTGYWRERCASKVLASSAEASGDHKERSRMHCGECSLDLVQFSIIAVPVEDASELHHLGLFIDRIHDPIFTLGDSKASEASVGEMRKLL